MKAPSAAWTKRIGGIVLAVGCLAGVAKLGYAGSQRMEVTIEPDKHKAANIGVLPPDVDSVEVIVNGNYDPDSNPKGYTGSAVYAPEGSIWKRTVDSMGRHVYRIAITSEGDRILLLTGTDCTGPGGGEGPCEETPPCVIIPSGPNDCGSCNVTTQQTATNTQAERLSKSEPGGGVFMPSMIAGEGFPDVKRLHQVAYRTIHIKVQPKVKKESDHVGYLRFTITGKGVALYHKSNKKRITEETRISVGSKGLDEDFQVVTNGEFLEPVTLQAHFSYTTTKNDEGSSSDCSEDINFEPCSCPYQDPQPPCVWPCCP